jgi:hypothetical protein
VDGEEIISVTAAADQVEFFGQYRSNLRRQIGAIARMRSLDDEVLEPVLRVPVFGHRFMRVFIAELVEREADARGEAERLGDCLGKTPEQPHHFSRTLQVSLGVDFQTTAGLGDRRSFTNAGEYVLQWALIGSGIECVTHCEQRHARRSDDLRELLQSALVVAPPVHRCAEPHAVRGLDGKPG